MQRSSCLKLLHHADPYAKEMANWGCEKRILESKNRFCSFFFGGGAKYKKGIMNPKYPHLRKIVQIKSKSRFFRFVIQAFSWRGMAKSVSGQRFPCDITLRVNSSEQWTQKRFGTSRVTFYLLEFHPKKKKKKKKIASSSFELYKRIWRYYSREAPPCARNVCWVLNLTSDFAPFDSEESMWFEITNLLSDYRKKMRP